MTESFPRPTGVATYTQTHGGDLKVGDTVKRYAIGALDFWKVVEVYFPGDTAPATRVRLEHRPRPGEQTKAPLDLKLPFGDREWSVVRYIPLPDYQPIIEGDGPLRVVMNGQTRMIPSRIIATGSPADPTAPFEKIFDRPTFESASRLEGATVAPPLMAYPRTAGEFAARWNSWSQDYRNTWMDRYNERVDEQIRQQEESALKAPGEFQIDDTGIGKVIWDASRVDEGSISATGATIIARALLAKFDIYPKGS